MASAVRYDSRATGQPQHPARQQQQAPPPIQNAHSANGFQAAPSVGPAGQGLPPPQYQPQPLGLAASSSTTAPPPNLRDRRFGGIDADALAQIDCTEETKEMYNAEARLLCLRYSMAQIGFGVLLICSFWAAYGWGIVVAGLAIFMGGVGYTHYQTPATLLQNTCCCQPLSFIQQQTHLHLILAVLAAVSVGSSIIGVITHDSTVLRVFAVIAALASLAILLVSVGCHQSARQLFEFCVAAHADFESPGNVIIVRRHEGAQPVDGEPTGPFATAGTAGTSSGVAFAPQNAQHGVTPPPGGNASAAPYPDMYAQQPVGYQHQQPPPPGMSSAYPQPAPPPPPPQYGRPQINGESEAERHVVVSAAAADEEHDVAAAEDSDNYYK